MKISNVKIVNFKRLKTFQLDLTENDSNLAFVNGTNGNGKSSFLSAFRWCFFGESISTSTFAYAALRDMREGDLEQISVEVKLQLNPLGDTSTISREQSVRAISTEQGIDVEFVGPEILNVTIAYANHAIPTEVIPEPKKWLETYLPQRFKRFILFDGELMYRFFDLSVKGAIEDAVREIAKIDLFDQAVEVVQELLNRTNQKVAKLSGSAAEKIQSEMETAAKVHSDYLSRLKLKRSEIDGCRHKIGEIQGKLRGKEDLERFLEANKSLRSALDLQLKRLSDLDGDLSRQILFTGVNSILISRTKYPVNRHVVDAAKTGKYPADFAPAALNELLSAQSCICGRHLEPGSVEASHLRSLVDVSLNAGDIGKELKKIEVGLAKTEGMVSQSQSASKAIIEAIKDARSEVDRLQKEIKDLQPQLTGIRGNHEEILELTRNLKTLERNLGEAVSEEAGMALRLEAYADQVSTLEKKFSKAQVNSVEVEGLKKKSQFLNRVLQQASNFSDEIIGKVRAQLQASISEKFVQVQGCNNLRVVLTENFDVMTLNELGKEPELSEGQKMALAYIFSISLREVVGLSFPLIVDTPLGRVSTLNKNLLANSLKELVSRSNEHQVILMMHDGEYTPYTKRDFATSSPLETYLCLSEDELQSTLEIGIDPDWLKREAWKDWAEGNIK